VVVLAKDVKSILPVLSGSMDTASDDMIEKYKLYVSEEVSKKFTMFLDKVEKHVFPYHGR
jgi:hypothetical protein